MQKLPAHIYKEISDNDMDQVVFTDPFCDVTRKYKRNLLTVSVIALLISILNLKISGFLGLTDNNGDIGNDIAQGIAFVFIFFYFLPSFCFHIYVDYIAWKFKQERQETKPYFNLIHLLESQLRATEEQIKNAVVRLDSIDVGDRMHIQIDASNNIQSAKQQLDSIGKNISNLSKCTTPLIESWGKTITKMESLPLRLQVRFANIWLLDIFFPLVISIVALYQSSSGFIPLLNSIMH